LVRSAEPPRTGERLSAEEAKALADEEDTIERWIAGGLEVGRALLRIRDQQLYRQGYGRFADYVEGRWQMSRRQAYRLLDWAKVNSIVCPNGHTGPMTEAVARELAPLRREPELLRTAWQEVHGDSPTARQVRELVQRTRPAIARPNGCTPRAGSSARGQHSVEADPEPMERSGRGRNIEEQSGAEERDEVDLVIEALIVMGDREFCAPEVFVKESAGSGRLRPADVHRALTWLRAVEHRYPGAYAEVCNEVHSPRS
jgi:hypothetical protein